MNDKLAPTERDGALFAANADISYQLHPHIRCATNSFNLIASADLGKENYPQELTRILRASMEKCSGVQNKVHRSVQASEVFEKAAGRSLIVLNVTRWNSEFLAVSCLVDVNAATNLDSVFDKIRLPRLLKLEWAFLAEYRDILAPIAQALDLLQNEKEAYLGTAIYSF